MIRVGHESARWWKSAVVEDEGGERRRGRKPCLLLVVGGEIRGCCNANVVGIEDAGWGDPGPC